MTPKTVWITIYALSDGIRECKVIRRGDEGGSHTVKGALIVEYPGWKVGRYTEPKDYCLTKEEAVTRAEGMRRKRLAHLEAEIERIKGLSFQ